MIFKILVENVKKDLNATQLDVDTKGNDICHIQKMVKIMTNGTTKLDEILNQEKDVHDKSRVGFNFVEWKPKVNEQSKKLIDEDKRKAKLGKIPERSCNSNKRDFIQGGTHFSHHESQHSNRRLSREKFIPICHYCNRPGHIRPYCRFYLRDMLLPMYLGTTSTCMGVMWFILTTSRSRMETPWCIDSGCSKYVIGKKNSLINIQECDDDYVVFGDGVCGKLIGSNPLNIPGMPPLDNILCVKESKVNLVNVSQFCDQGLDVKFDKDRCVTQKNKVQFIVRSKSIDNCYLVTLTVTRNKVSPTNTYTLHKNLGHRGNTEASTGIPTLHDNISHVSGSYQGRKQVCVSDAKCFTSNDCEKRKKFYSHGSKVE